MNEQRGSTNNPSSIPPISQFSLNGDLSTNLLFYLTDPNSTETNRLQQQESQQNDGQDPTKQNK